MQIYKFTTKLNKLDNNIYSIEEEINVVNGKYKGFLEHDNVNINSLNVYTGSKLTGEKINSYILSTPSETPWKTEIELYTKLDTVYITYETVGDTIEAEDINILQDSIVYVQEEFNKYQKSNDNKVSELVENKVDKVQGKQLSTNDYTNAEKDKLSNIEENANRYIHPNDSNIRHVTDAEKDIWSSKETVEGSQAKSTKALNDAKSYTNTKINDLIGGEINTYNTLKKIEDAIKNHELEYSDLLTVVNKKADSSHNHDSVYLGKNDNSVSATKLQTARTINGTNFDGGTNITTANWGTARTLTIGNTGKSVNGSANVSWSLSEMGAAATSHTHNSAMYTNLSNQTVSLNTYTLSSGTPHMAFYYCPTDGGGANITGRPNDSTKNAFSLKVELLRWVSTTDYISKQTYIRGNEKIMYVRYCTSGTWSTWEKIYTSVNKPTVSEIGAAASSHNHTKSQISDFPTKLSQFEDDLGIGQLPSKFTWNMLKGV